MEWTPAFPGQRPPFAPGNELGFAPGNTLSVRSGAFSERFVDPLALEIVEQLIEVRPDVARHPHMLASTARLGARAALLSAFIDRSGLFDGKGRIREGALRWHSQFERQFMAGLRELGLGPAAEARLTRDQAVAAATIVDLSAVGASGQMIREQLSSLQLRSASTTEPPADPA